MIDPTARPSTSAMKQARAGLASARSRSSGGSVTLADASAACQSSRSNARSCAPARRMVMRPASQMPAPLAAAPRIGADFRCVGGYERVRLGAVRRLALFGLGPPWAAAFSGRPQ